MFQKVTALKRLLKTLFSQRKIFGIKRQGALGDVLLITPIIHELKKRYPDARIWIQTGCKEALRHHPDVDKVVSQNIERKAHTIIDLNLAYESQPKLHLVDAYSQKAFGADLEDKRPFLYSSAQDEKRLARIVKGQLDLAKEAFIVMHQAVSWENRTWPIASWNQVVEGLLQDGFKVVIIGRKKDFSYLKDPRVINLHSQLTLSAIRELIKKSQLFIGPDSALIHIAMTTKTPIIGLFTVADPKLRVTREHNVIALTPTSSCRFCLHDIQPPVEKISCRFGTNHCLKEITPENVLHCAKQMLGIRS